MKLIKLWHNKTKKGLSVGKYAMVDDEHFEWLNQWRWSYVKKKNNEYARRTQGQKGIKQITLFMHVEIMKRAGLFDERKEVDHQDNNGLNNQVSNLRMATRQENSFNSKKHAKGVSKYKGVWKTGRSQGFRAAIKYNGTLVLIGNFANEIEAAIAYDRKAEELFGEFAKLNFPEVKRQPASRFPRFCQKKTPKGKTGFRGVYLTGKNFRAGIWLKGEQLWLGIFQNPIDAAKAYDRKARELFGEFAVCNFPQEDL